MSQLPKGNSQHKVKTKGRISNINIVVVVVITFLGWVIWKTYQAGNLGFSGKTLWDWLGLIGVPAIIALLVFALNKSQKDTEIKIAEARRIEDSKTAEQRENFERELEKDRQRQKSLDDYLDRMTDLLLTHKLSGEPSNEARSIARTRTLTILKDLDGTRKSQLIQFLYESSLIGKFSEEGIIEAIIDLSFADLQGIEFTYGGLDGVNFSKSNVRNTNFEMASLIGANFYLADLDDSNFSWTKLMGANLHAGLRRVNFASANLTKANLKSANLSGARLWHTNFTNANLQYANFMFRNQYSIKDEANLEPASLMNVDFTKADLTKALISTIQLRAARSLSNTIMPNGQVFEEWKKTNSLRNDVNFEADTLLSVS